MAETLHQLSTNECTELHEIHMISLPLIVYLNDTRTCIANTILNSSHSLHFICLFIVI